MNNKNIVHFINFVYDNLLLIFTCMFLGGCIAFGFTIMAQIKDVSPIIQTDKFATTTASTDTIAILKLEDSNTQQIVKEIQKTNLLLADIDNVLRHKK